MKPIQPLTDHVGGVQPVVRCYINSLKSAHPPLSQICTSPAVSNLHIPRCLNLPRPHYQICTPSTTWQRGPPHTLNTGAIWSTRSCPISPAPLAAAAPVAVAVV